MLLNGSRRAAAPMAITQSAPSLAVLDRRTPAARPSPVARSKVDVLLGEVPLLWLDAPAGRSWTDFWRLARIIDQDLERGVDVAAVIEARRIPPEWDPTVRALAVRLQQRWSDDAEGRIIERTCLRGVRLMQELQHSLPPSAARYRARAHARTLGPLLQLCALAEPRIPLQRLRPAAAALGVAIALGDDLRDLRADRSVGCIEVTLEELALIGASTCGGIDAVLDSSSLLRRLSAVRSAMAIGWAVAAEDLAAAALPQQRGGVLGAAARLWSALALQGALAPTSESLLAELQALPQRPRTSRLRRWVARLSDDPYLRARCNAVLEGAWVDLRSLPHTLQPPSVRASGRQTKALK